MSGLLRILHLEDEPNDSELVQARLASDGLAHQLIQAASQAVFTKALEQNTFDLILADQNLPTFDGMSALALARARHPDIPFIFDSGALSEEQAIDTLKQGATDYVFKTRLSRLAPA